MFETQHSIHVSPTETLQAIRAIHIILMLAALYHVVKKDSFQLAVLTFIHLMTFAFQVFEK